MTGKYAADTTVPVDRSRSEIEKTLTRYGATGFFFATEQGKVAIGFRCNARIIRMILAAPDAKRLTERQVEAENRRRWRVLNLVIKAKLESVASGVSTFEQEFLAFIVMPNGDTVGNMVAAHIGEAYKTGQNVPLLPGSTL